MAVPADSNGGAGNTAKRSLWGGAELLRQLQQLIDYRTYLGFIACGVMLCAVIGQTLINPEAHTVTGVYRLAAETFLRAGKLYPSGSQVDGFLYLPGFAVLYLPFDLVGARIGDVLWKATGLALLTYAAWSNCRELDRALRVHVLSLALLISIPLLSGSVLNGQTNMHMAGACWLAILSAFRRQPVTVVLWVCVAVLAKPLAIVTVLLIAGLRPGAIPALTIGIACAIALPFVVADPKYVMNLYEDYWQLLVTMSSDRAIASSLPAFIVRSNWPIGSQDVLVIRCVAAVVTWLLALTLFLRLRPNAAALAVIIFAASYMCLFNPRAEDVTYSIIALPCAVVIATHYYDGQSRMLWIALAAILMAMGCNGIFGEIYALTKFWYRPACTVLLLMLVGITLAQIHWGTSRRSLVALDRAE